MFEQSLGFYINWSLSLTIGLLTLYLVRFYSRVFKLPKGPFPLPVIGSILIFRKTKVNQFLTINELHKKYGPVYTLWFGTTPFVIVNDYQLIKTAFNSKNNELMGRPVTGFTKMLLGNGSDVVFAQHGPTWASLRKVAHSAVRKLAISDKLSDLVDDVVIETVETIKTTEGINKPFNPTTYIYMTVLNIIASSAFGKRYSVGDEELKFYEQSFEKFRANNNVLLLTDRIPVLKLFYYNVSNRVLKAIENLFINIKQKYRDHLTNHQKDEIRDFCDALIEAKEEAISEDKETAPHLNDTNLALVISNLFFAGSDTTQYMLRWIILLMANNTEMQIKMREEVRNIIGDRVATHEDKNHCHYINAFIMESLRFRGVFPLGVPHRAMTDYKLGDYTIPTDTLVMGNLNAVSQDLKYWPKPEVFDPNRFLTEDNELKSSVNAFTPFGIGRRICLGEKLAMADLFLITVRLLKSTSDYILVLPDGEGTADLEPNPDVLNANTPKPYEILLRNR